MSERHLTGGAGKRETAFALYFTGSDTNALLVDPVQRDRTLSYFSPLRLEKVYLEFGHQNEQVREEDMRAISAALKTRGIGVATAMVPAHQGTPYCYNNPEHMGFLEKQARFCAEVSDELIIDDWLFTTCKCPVCVKERGSRTWSEYRTALLTGKTAVHLLDPAKKANPGIRIIIKYPNWFEGHALNGYAVTEQIRQFDGFCIGVETRHQEMNDQHIPLASAYLTPKWYAHSAPEKFLSTWIDNCGMNGHEPEYPTQAVLSVLAGAKEIILWCAGTHYRINTWNKITKSRWDRSNPWASAYRELLRRLPMIRKLPALVSAPSRGIPIYLPYGSEGEYNLFGFLGMAGLPLEPVAEFPDIADGLCVLTEHSYADPDLAVKIFRRLESGRDVLLTGRLFRRLQETEIGKAFQTIRMDGVVDGKRFATRGFRTKTGGPFYSDKTMSFQRMQISTWPYDNRIALNRADANFTVLGAARFLNATLYVLNVPENSDDLLHLPETVLDCFRRTFYPGFDSCLEGPSRVGLFCYADGTRVLYNMSHRSAKTALLVAGMDGSGVWRDLLSGRKPRVVRGKDGERISVRLSAWEMAVLKKD